MAAARGKWVAQHLAPTRRSARARRSTRASTRTTGPPRPVEAVEAGESNRVRSTSRNDSPWPHLVEEGASAVGWGDPGCPRTCTQPCMVSARGRTPTGCAEPRRRRRSSASGDSVPGSVVAWVDSPSGDSPKAVATASTIVDFPDPFSPTRKVTNGDRSRPSRASCVTAGDRHRPGRGIEAALRVHLDVHHGRLVEVHLRNRTTDHPQIGATPPRSRRRRSRSRSTTGSSVCSTPDRVYFPESGATKLDLVVLPRGRAGDRQRPSERPHAAPLPEGPRGRQGAPEAGLPAGAPPCWVETVQLYFLRWGRTADGSASPSWLGHLGRPDVDGGVPPVEQPAPPPSSPTSGASTSTSAPRRLRHRAAGRARAHEVLDEARRRGLPQDQRQQGLHTSTCGPPGPRLRRPSRAAFAREVERRAPRT